jgi:CheY-like chemotaxis protein
VSTEGAAAAAEEKDIAERRELLGELVAIRGHLATNAQQNAEIIRLLAVYGKEQDRQGHELGHIKTHMTEKSLTDGLPDVKPNGLEHRRVLVVEDDVDLLNVTERLLRKLGCVVATATNRTEGERRLTELEFDAALVDLRLPPTVGADGCSDEGVELCRWITRMYPKIGIVVMSGRLEAEGLDLLPVLRLCKPFTVERLHDKLEQAIHGVGPATADTVPPAELVRRTGEFAAFEPTTLQSVEDTEPDTLTETPEARAAAKG